MIDLNHDPAIQALFPHGTILPPFRAVQCDSRCVQCGDLFVAVSGCIEDGARFATAAREAGAVGVVGEDDIADWRVANARQALALLVAASYDYPSRHLLNCGITGTNGKTTTAWLLRDMLAQGGLYPGLLTTVSVSYPGYEEEAERTTPDAIELQRTFAQMHKAGCKAAVMEVSSHAIDQHRIGACAFAVKGFTNLTQDHLDYHKTMENYYAVKKAFLTDGNVPIVINMDDAYGRRLCAELKGIPCLTYGLTAESDVYADHLVLTADGATFDLHFPIRHGVQLNYHVHTRLTGRYNISNILCAVAMATTLGVWPEMIVTAITEAKPKWGRLECVAPRVFIDYAHTDDALAQVLSTLREVTPGRLICVFGCGGDRDRTKRPKMGCVVAEKADVMIITSDNPRTEDPATIIQEIEQGILEARRQTPSTYRVVMNRGDAIDVALSLQGADDTVLIAGKGHEPYQEINGVKYPFSDIDHVKAYM